MSKLFKNIQIFDKKISYIFISKRYIFGRTQNVVNSTVTDRFRSDLLMDDKCKPSMVASRISISFDDNINKLKSTNGHNSSEFVKDMLNVLKKGTDIHKWRELETVACTKVNTLRLQDLLLLSDIFYKVSLNDNDDI